MTALIILLAIWAAGGFVSIGALKGVSVVEKSDITSEIYIVKFIQSWYAFGEIVLIMLSEIANQISENLKK